MIASGYHQTGQRPRQVSPDDLSTWRDTFVRRRLEECDGNKSEAARSLGIARRTLQRMLLRRP